MKIKSLFISAKEVNSGMLFVSMGMMEVLKRNLQRVAFFRPIIYKESIVDGDMKFILERYNLALEYEDAYGFDVAYVEDMISKNKTKELINQLLMKFKKLESEYDFVLCEGIRGSFLNANIDFDVNIKIAQNFGSPLINIINGKESSSKEIYESLLRENKTLASKGCTHFATFINRVDKKKHLELSKKLKGYEYTTYLLEEVAELSLLSIQDIIESLNAKPVLLSEKDHTRSIRAVKVAALSLDNFFDYIEEDDLVIVPLDRSEIILGLYGALFSNEYPNISCIVFPLGMQAHPNIQKLIKGLQRFKVPILSVETDTFNTARNLRSYVAN